MPFIQVHGPADLDEGKRRELLGALRASLSHLPGVAADGGHAVYYPSAGASRAAHGSRDARFVFIELSALAGRSDDAKQAFAKAAFEAAKAATGAAEKDIQINIAEFERRHWFVGGILMREK